MSAAGIYQFLFDWAKQVLITEAGLTITIIQAHQDAPSPTGLYLAIEAVPNRQKIGSASFGDVELAGAGPLEHEVLVMVNDYVLSVELWEVGGTGEALRILLDSLDRPDIQGLWTTAGFSMLVPASPIQHMPNVQNSRWTKECFVELRIGTAEKTEDLSGSLAIVEIAGTIPAQGRSGDIDVAITNDIPN